MAMKKAELKELYGLMFPDYPDIVTVRQLQTMLSTPIPKTMFIIVKKQREDLRPSCCFLAES